ncbi:MAG: 30S ribosomal protein S6 [Nitrospinota bacterium]|nr:30S ribosomal protein S6 [Nitrospinota bacterium]
MRQYETMVLLSPELDEDAVEKKIQDVENHFKKNGSEIISIDRLGKKRLAYPINKQRHGTYFVISYKAEKGVVSELEQGLRLDEDTFRYMTTRIEQSVLRKIQKTVDHQASQTVTDES